MWRVSLRAEREVYMLYDYKVFLSTVGSSHAEYITLAEIEDPTVEKLIAELACIWDFDHDEPFGDVWTVDKLDVESVVCVNNNGDAFSIVVAEDWVRYNQQALNDRQKRLAEKLGEDLCDIQIIEEASELQKALCKKFRATHGGFQSADMDKLHADIVEELGDLLACAENIKYLYNISEIELQQARDAKLKRAYERYGIEEEQQHG